MAPAACKRGANAAVSIEQARTPGFRGATMSFEMNVGKR
jgi:hypothetical protein